MRENIFQQIVACTWWKDGQIDLIFNENKNEFLSRRCHQQMEEKLQVSHLADLTACFAAMLEVLRAGYPLNFGTSQFVLRIYPLKVYSYNVDIFTAFFYAKYMNIHKLRGKKNGRGENHLWPTVLTSLTIN